MKLLFLSNLICALAVFHGVVANPAAIPVPADAAAPAPASVPAPALTDAASADSWPSYVVVFESGMETPDAIVKALENKLKQLGALITYEYNTVIKGFTVKAPKTVMDQVHTEEKDCKFPFIIEEDKTVTIAQGN